MAKMNGSDTLVVDITGTPLGFVSWKDAVRLYHKDKASILHEDMNRVLHSDSFEMGMPTVVQVRNRVARAAKMSVPFTRRNLAIRDDSTCQYCGKVLATHQYTMDHVLPRSQGGISSWTNLCICCQKCNRYKGGKTPEQAGMKLLKPLIEPSRFDNRYHFRIHLRKIRPEWMAWLAAETKSYEYWNTLLDP